MQELPPMSTTIIRNASNISWHGILYTKMAKKNHITHGPWRIKCQITANHTDEIRCIWIGGCWNGMTYVYKLANVSKNRLMSFAPFFSPISIDNLLNTPGNSDIMSLFLSADGLWLYVSKQNQSLPQLVYEPKKKNGKSGNSSENPFSVKISNHECIASHFDKPIVCVFIIL